MSANIPAYFPYPKQFTPYKWYKPLLTALLMIVFFFVFSTIVGLIGSVLASAQGVNPVELMQGGYDHMDAYSVHGAITSLGSIAMFLPALLLANRIVNARSFSSYSSSRGGFDFGVFFKTLIGALVCIGLPLTLQTLLTQPQSGNIRFTVAGLIVCLILVPLQCCAEEYVFRGLAMQTFGSWIKLPVIPIILQTLLFAAMHPYNIFGVISVALMGAGLGVCAYITNGLEASCAAHIVNNLTAFLFAGFGFGAVQSEVDVFSVVIIIPCFCLYIAFLLFAKKKLGWFGKVRKDDAALFNQKIALRKQA
ncbi:MAG: CPBP family intramembrane metalloprotease [Ruminococcus sp.]|nr:CPBP family intramembrane metalloprotease [Ruminococcus sp.]